MGKFCTNADVLKAKLASFGFGPAENFRMVLFKVALEK
jgi:hypothetical protein